MIVVNIMGGLGNQMFQYAMGKTLATRLNTSLWLDISSLNIRDTKAQTRREFQLSGFSIQANVLGSINDSVYQKFFRSIILNAITRNKMIEKRNTFNSSYLNSPNNSKLVGYFQSEKYFKEIKKQIVNDFQFKSKPSLGVKVEKIIDTSNSVAIHVRRGDYVTNKGAIDTLGVLPINYYKDAIKKIENKVENPKFIIISDDITWCKKNMRDLFNEKPIFFSGTEYQDLFLLTQVDHNIIANSSFSWWGAYLNNNPNKSVIAPKRWFNDREYSIEDLIPSSWNVL